MKRVLVLAAALAMVVAGTAQAAHVLWYTDGPDARMDFRAPAGERNTVAVNSPLGVVLPGNSTPSPRTVLVVGDSTAPKLSFPIVQGLEGACLGPGVRVVVCETSTAVHGLDGVCLGPGVRVVVCEVRAGLGTFGTRIDTDDGNDYVNVSRLTPLPGPIGRFSSWVDGVFLGDGNDVLVGNGTPYGRSGITPYGSSGISSSMYISCGTGYDVVTNAGQAEISADCESVQR